MQTCESAAKTIGCYPDTARWLCRRYSIGVLVNRSRRELSDADIEELRRRVENPQSRIRSARSGDGKFSAQPAPDLSGAIVSLREAARRYRTDKGTLAAALAIVRAEWQSAWPASQEGSSANAGMNDL